MSIRIIRMVKTKFRLFKAGPIISIMISKEKNTINTIKITINKYKKRLFANRPNKYLMLFVKIYNSPSRRITNLINTIKLNSIIMKQTNIIMKQTNIIMKQTNIIINKDNIIINKDSIIINKDSIIIKTIHTIINKLIIMSIFSILINIIHSMTRIT